MQLSWRSSVLVAAALAAAPSSAALVRSCPPGASDACITVGVSPTGASTGSGNLYMQIRATTDYQWVAFGTGRMMLNSNMFIVYQDGLGNVTVSPRHGTFHTTPQLDTSATAARLVLLEGSGVVGGEFIANLVCANCDSWNGGTMALNSASASWVGAWRKGVSIASTSQSASIVQHDSTVTFTFDLTKAALTADANPFVTASTGDGSGSGSGSGSGTGSGSGDGSGTGSTGGSGSDGSGAGGSGSSGSDGNTISDGTITGETKDAAMLLAAHGILMAIVFVVLYPAGSALMPLLGKWFLHAGFQIIAFVAMWAGFGLGIQLAMDRNLLFNNTHTLMGTVVVCLLVLQPLLGLAHHRHYVRNQSRGLVSYVHIWYGRILMVLGVVNGGLGLQLALASNNLVIAYAVVAAAMFVLVYGGAKIIGVLRGGLRSPGTVRSKDEGLSSREGNASGVDTPRRLGRWY